MAWTHVRAKIANAIRHHRRTQATPRVAGRKTPNAVGAGRGQAFGFVLALIAFGGAIALSVIGMPNLGAKFLSPPVLALIAAFVVGR